MDEFELIHRYFSRLGVARADVLLGVGDDAAILRARKQLAEAAKAVAAGEAPLGVVRDPKDNDFSDLVVITKRLPASISPQAYCAELAASDLYTLAPLG